MALVCNGEPEGGNGAAAAQPPTQAAHAIVFAIVAVVAMPRHRLHPLRRLPLAIRPLQRAEGKADLGAPLGRIDSAAAAVYGQFHAVDA